MKAAGIDDDAGGRLARLVDPVDDLVLAVRLVESDLEAEFARHRPAVALDVGQRLVAVDVRLALAEQVEVRTVQDVDEAAHMRSLSLQRAGTPGWWRQRRAAVNRN